LENGIPYENPFITTAGQGIVIQNWLYCVIVAFFYNNWESIGLWVLQTIQLLLMFAVIFWFFNAKHSNNKIIIGFFACIILKVFYYTNLRPEMLTFILIVFEIIGIEKYLETNKKQWLLLLSFTTWLEINCHASYWIMHFVVILPYCVPALPKIFEEDNEKPEKKIEVKDLILPLISMIALMFINPYGIKAILYVFYAITSGVLSYWKIEEQSPFCVNNLTVFVWIATLFTNIFDFVVQKQNNIV
jgi:hypothetical protein